MEDEGCANAPQISSLLEQKAVLLRLEGGSTEAGFLAAFCDVSATPTFIVIHNGKLQLQLGKDVSKDEFVNSIRTILGAEALPGATPTPQASTAQAQAPAEDDLYGAPEPVRPTPTPPQAPVRAPAPAPTTSNAKGKQKAAPPSQAELEAQAAAANATKQAARDALRKKKREEADELARVKARIEQDKAARKAAAAARAAERERERTGASTTPAPQPSPSTRGSQAQNVHLHVRLFDGKTIRHVFPRTATLQGEVRTWVETEFRNLDAADANAHPAGSLPPFYFRHLLPPQPARELSAGDEAQHLGDIDLAPSATLVLVPVKGYTQAYAANEGVVGAASGLVGGAFGLLSSTVGYVGSALGAVVGFGSGSGGDSGGAAGDAQTAGRTVGGSEAAPRDGNTQQARAGAEGIRVRTLADQRAREPQTFYNGNQVSAGVSKERCVDERGANVRRCS
jgi:hypothetical protein